MNVCKKIVNFIMVFTIVGIMIWLVIKEYSENRIESRKEPKYNVESLNSNDVNQTQEENMTKQYPKEEIIEEYRGYKVSANLEIPKINLKTYILQNYSIQALNMSVVKFWGVNANQIGNFCIAGHNFNSNMFRNLYKLEIGDELFIADNDIGKVEYEIYSIYAVEPSDTSCLDEETNGKREVTLITCTNNSQKRIIVKAREKEV